MAEIRTVSIIGAGLSGLCLAQGLNKRGLPFRVFEAERTPETRNQGYRISLDENGIRALEDCLPTHLFDLFQATSGISGGSFQMLRGDLKTIFRFRFDLKEGDDPRYVSFFATMLTGLAVGQPIVDKTGLTGRYNITVKSIISHKGQAPGTAEASDPGDSIFAAMEAL